MSGWGEFTAKPIHLLFGAVAIVCAFGCAMTTDNQTLVIGWSVLGVAGLVWLGFVGAALMRQRRRRSST